MRRLVGIALVLACAGACRSKRTDEAPCGAVAGRMFALAHEELAKATVDVATRRAVTDQLPAMRDALAQACSKGAWSGEARHCMGNAVDHAAFQACQATLTDDQRRALDRAARGETGSR